MECKLSVFVRYIELKDKNFEDWVLKQVKNEEYIDDHKNWEHGVLVVSAVRVYKISNALYVIGHSR